MATYVGEVPCAGGRLVATAQVTRGARRIELRVVPGRKGRRRRADPEACYAELNGGVALTASRRTRIGREERRALVDRAFPGLPPPRAPRGATAADVLDALVCLWAAERLRFRLVRD
jgi:predicted RNase H-like nuclease